MTHRTTGPRYKYPNECVTNDVVTHHQEATDMVIRNMTKAAFGAAFPVRPSASSIQ